LKNNAIREGCIMIHTLFYIIDVSIKIKASEMAKIRRIEHKKKKCKEMTGEEGGGKL